MRDGNDLGCGSRAGGVHTGNLMVEESEFWRDRNCEFSNFEFGFRPLAAANVDYWSKRYKYHCK